MLFHEVISSPKEEFFEVWKGLPLPDFRRITLFIRIAMYQRDIEYEKKDTKVESFRELIFLLTS